MCDWWEAVDWAPGGDARETPSWKPASARAEASNTGRQVNCHTRRPEIQMISKLAFLHFSVRWIYTSLTTDYTHTHAN